MSNLYENIINELCKIDDSEDRIKLILENIDSLSLVKKKIFISELKKQLKNNITNLVSLKNFSMMSGNYEIVDKYRKDIKLLKKVFYDITAIDIIDIKTKNRNQTIRRSRNTFDLNLNSIFELDLCLEINNYDKFQKIFSMNDNMYEEKIILLSDIKDNYLKNQNKLYYLRDKLKQSKDENKLNSIRRLIRTKTLALNYVNKYIAYLNALKLSTSRKSKSDSIFVDDFKITKYQKDIVSQILNGNKLDTYDVNDIVMAVKYIIYNYKFVDVKDSLLQSVNIVIDRTDLTDLQEELIYLVLDTLKHVKKTLDKKDINKRYINEFIKYLENILIYKDQSPFNDINIYDYDIINYFLSNRNYYYYLKKIIEDNPDFVNLRCDGKHILIDILERYIQSAKDELQNQKFDYINKIYYKNLYLLFSESQFLSLNKEDKKIIDDISENFITYLSEKKYKEENKTSIIQDFDSFINKSISINVEDISIEEVNAYLSYVPDMTSDLINDSKRVKFIKDYLEKLNIIVSKYENEFYEKYYKMPNDDILSDETGFSVVDIRNSRRLFENLMFDNKNLVYSIIENNDNEMYFCVSTIDMTSYIRENETLDKYLSSNVGVNVLPLVDLEVGNAYPMITHQIRISPNGYIDNLKVYKSVVKIDRRVSTFENYREDYELKKFVTLYKRLTNVKGNVNIFELENYLKNLIQNSILLTSDHNSIPIIASGIKKLDVDRIVKSESDLGYLFAKLNNDRFNLFIKPLESNLDEIHYVSENYFDGEYLYRIDSCLNYIDLYNQRTLLNYENIRNDKNVQKELQMRSYDLAEMANSNMGYVKDLKFKKKRK